MLWYKLTSEFLYGIVRYRCYSGHIGLHRQYERQILNYRSWYYKNKTNYEIFVIKVSDLIDSVVVINDVPYLKVQHRVKDLEGFLRKAEQLKCTKDPYKVNDLAGIRIICYLRRVLINCAIGSEKHIISKLNNLSGVEEVSEVNGVYDIIVKVNSDSIDKLKETITTGIRRIDTVRSTLTLIVIE